MNYALDTHRRPIDRHLRHQHHHPLAGKTGHDYTCELSDVPTGEHALYLVFTGMPSRIADVQLITFFVSKTIKPYDQSRLLRRLHGTIILPLQLQHWRYLFRSGVSWWE